MRATTTLFVLLFGMAVHAQSFYAAGALSAGNGPDLSASYASVELGVQLGSIGAGLCFGRDLAATESAGLYFLELRGTQTLVLFDDGPQPYVSGGIGQYLDGRWVNEFGAGLCWPSGIAVGGCSFGGAGFLSVSWTGSFRTK